MPVYALTVCLYNVKKGAVNSRQPLFVYEPLQSLL